MLKENERDKRGAEKKEEREKKRQEKSELQKKKQAAKNRSKGKGKLIERKRKRRTAVESDSETDDEIGIVPETSVSGVREDSKDSEDCGVRPSRPRQSRNLPSRYKTRE